jgi:2-methylcitrate synthase/citrate synthase II
MPDQPDASSSSERPSYSPGLAGVIAGETAICQVDPSGILLYRGYDIHELAGRARFEDVAHLLIRGTYPTPAESDSTRSDLAAEATLPPEVMDALRLFPDAAHPIDVLRTAVSMLGSFDPDANDNSHDANVRKAIRLTAKVGAIVPAAWRIAHGEEPLFSPDLPTFSWRFLHNLVGGEGEPVDWLPEALDVLLILYAEHEFNASTFAARVTASTLSDMHSAVTSALGTLKGPLHGGANEEAMKVLTEVSRPERAAAWVKEKLARREKIMGFGHRVYRTGDSRVPVMRDVARRLGKIVGDERWADICEALEAAMAAEKGLCANVDLYAAPVLHMMGIPPALNTAIFACARMAGWCAHVIEQHDHNRLIRPRSLYTGPARRTAAG